MNCKHCGERDTATLETREWKGVLTRRRRECLGCGRKFETYEVPGSLLRRHEVERYARGISKRALAISRRIDIAAAPPEWSAKRVAKAVGVSATTVLNVRRIRAIQKTARMRAAMAGAGS